jgi:autophagy-related protein 16-1
MPVATFSHESFRPGSNWTRSCFSADARFVGSGSADGGVLVWDVNSTQVAAQFKDHKSSVCGIVWDPIGGGNVYSASQKEIHYWGV